MAIRLGNGSIVNITLGDQQVQAVYLGDTKVWPEEPAGTAFTMSAGTAIVGNACSMTGAIPRYHDGTEALPKAGDTIFEDAALQNPFLGGLQYYKISESYVQVDSAGLITIMVPCSGATSFLMSAGNSNTTLVCGQTPEFTFYHDGVTPTPEIGDIVYEDEVMLIPLNGGNLYYYIGNDLYIRISTNGSVSSIGTCV